MVETGEIGMYGLLIPKFRGKIDFKIYEKPRFTILNAGQRSPISGAEVIFKNSTKPFLHVEMAPRAGYFTSVRALNSIKSGMKYFEVQLKRLSLINNDVILTNKNPTNNPQISGKQVSLINKKYIVRFHNGTHEMRDLKENDIIRVAFDKETGKLWVAVNEYWLGSKIGPESRQLKEKNSVPQEPSLRLPTSEELALEKEWWPQYTAGAGGEAVFNFGDQPWQFTPPTGFEGIAYEPHEYPNIWNSSSGSYHTEVTGSHPWKTLGRETKYFNRELIGTSTGNVRPITDDNVSESILAMSPRRSGKWQFAIEIDGYPDSVVVGIAPTNFNTRVNQKVGTAGTNSIGLQPLSKEPGEKFTRLYIDGRVIQKPYPGTGHFTFVCDFDEKTIEIFHQGTPLFKEQIPEGVASWSIASSNFGASTVLHTTDHDTHGKMLFPIKGVKIWDFDQSPCRTCVQETPPLEETTSSDIVTCPDTYFAKSGLADQADTADICLIKSGALGRTHSCTIPPKNAECKQRDNGKFYCVNDIGDYDSLESCQPRCLKNTPTTGKIEKVCKENGWQ
jgi:hypothetical protein